jgi:hypothetical protein
LPATPNPEKTNYKVIYVTQIPAIGDAMKLGANPDAGKSSLAALYSLPLYKWILGYDLSPNKSLIKKLCGECFDGGIDVSNTIYRQ